MAATIADIARALRRPPPPTDRDRNVVTGLMAREPGFALFYAYLDQAAPDPEWRRLAHRHLDRAIARVPRMSGRPFFSYGFAGTAWAVEHLNGRLLDAGEDLNDEVDEALLTLVERGPALSYDLQYGLVGFGVYALERLPRGRSRGLLEAVIARLAREAEPSRRGARTWATHDARWRVQRQQPTGPVYHLDLYNGITGVIALLGAAIHHGVAVDTARPLADAALRFLWRCRTGGLFPARSHLSLAGGSLGIAVACHLAARAAGMDQWQAPTLALARRLAADRRALRDATLGRGAAGAAHLFHRLYRLTGEAGFADATRCFVERLLARRRPGSGLAGFRVYNPVWQRGFLNDRRHPVGWIGLPGLINGVAGIGLCLLSVLHGQEPSWDRAFLLSHR